jgi:hypothetical protein
MSRTKPGTDPCRPKAAAQVAVKHWPAPTSTRPTQGGSWTPWVWNLTALPATGINRTNMDKCQGP